MREYKEFYHIVANIMGQKSQGNEERCFRQMVIDKPNNSISPSRLAVLKRCFNPLLSN